MATALDPSGPPPPPIVPEAGDDGGAGGDGRDDATDRRPSWVQALLLALACVFAGAAGMYWWDHRPDDPNAADVGFYDDMTVHHQQAIDMALVYLRNGTDPILRHMADEIVLFQAGDIRTMQTALQDWNKSPNDDVAMAWMGTPVAEDEQPGMANAGELAQLRDARGRALDDLFSRLMINHHAGGAHMADAEARLGHDHDERVWAEKLADAQRQEIHELNFARTRLGLEPAEPVFH
jgi:uncharacterized protein (DUF305 family)